MKNTLKRLIPGPLKAKARRGYYATFKPLEMFMKKSFHFIPDTLGLLMGKRAPLTPPQWMNSSGDGDFKEIGNEFLHYFIKLGSLKPNEKVLEVGCGIGRMAVPLMDYLKEGGSYDGFDIIPHGIRWCRKQITSRASNFHFQLADIYNYGYNPLGKYKAAEYVFPYENETFDFVFLTSVFTHMMPQDMEHYFSEIRRVLKPWGRCFITFFLLNKESLACINAGSSALDFKYKNDGYRINDRYIPEEAVAYNEEYILGLYPKNKMKITPLVRYGSWCGRKNFLSYQDIILAVKEYEQ